MFNENEFSGLIGQSDEGFRNNFDNTLEKLKSTESVQRRIRRPRWKMAVAIAAACIVLTGTAYAATQIFLDRVDIGASWEIVAAPEDYYESVGASIFRAAYNSDSPLEEQLPLDSKTARELRKLLKGQIFNENGETIEVKEILVPIPDSDEFRIDAGDGALYNAEGEELFEIRYETIGYSAPQSLWLWTKSERDAAQRITDRAERDARKKEIEEQGFGWAMNTDDYQEAAEMLGANFVLPGVYIEDCESPVFKMQKEMSGRKAVYVTYKGIDKYNPGIFYFAEPEREEGQEPESWFFEGCIIEEIEIDGLPVYTATSTDGAVRYTWTQDGVIYMIFQSSSIFELTAEQFMEIIADMIK